MASTFLWTPIKMWYVITLSLIPSYKYSYCFQYFGESKKINTVGEKQWSRFSGGSGAPMWTFYAAGLNPPNFRATEAAMVQNLYPDPANYPKMIWSTNYTRFACQVMFTLFFAGSDFAPKAIID